MAEPIDGSRPLLARLPWYDLAEACAGPDALWDAVAIRLRIAGIGNVPATLSRGEDYEVPWRSGRLLLSQCCGYDLHSALSDHLQVVATPSYCAPGCEGWHYRSVVIVRADSP